MKFVKGTGGLRAKKGAVWGGGRGVTVEVVALNESDQTVILTSRT